MTLLKNPLYKGVYISGRRVSERGRRRKAPPEDWHYAREIIDELIIINPKAWDKAEQIRSARQRRPSEKTNYPVQTKGPLLLVGLLSCGHCRSVMASRYAVKKWTQKKSGKEIRYLQPKYICQKRNTQNPCSGPTTYSQKRVDPPLLEEVYPFFAKLSVIDYADQVYARKQSDEKRLTDDIKRHHRQIDKIQKEINLLHTEIIKCLSGDSLFSPDQLNKILDQKQNELALERESVQGLTHKSHTAAPSVPVPRRALIPDWRDEFDHAPVPVKKMLLAWLIEDVFIYRERMDIYLRYNPLPEG